MPLVAKRLQEAGLLHEDAITVTGRDGRRASPREATETAGQQVVRPLDDPIKPTGGLAILRGNLAPEGCVVKLSGHERRHHTGPARVFEGEEAAMDAVIARARIEPGDVVVIRNEGPAGGPGMREMLAVTAAINGAGLGEHVALLTDGRFSRRHRTASWPATSRPRRSTAARSPRCATATRSPSTSTPAASTSSSTDDEIAERVAAYEPPAAPDATGVLAQVRHARRQRLARAPSRTDAAATAAACAAACVLRTRQRPLGARSAGSARRRSR